MIAGDLLSTAGIIILFAAEAFIQYLCKWQTQGTTIGKWKYEINSQNQTCLISTTRIRATKIPLKSV